MVIGVLVGTATVTTQGSQARYDTTNEEWGLLLGQNRGPPSGHQWGLFHGHGQRASFVPPQPIRELRDLARTRTAITRERSREVQRLEKTGRCDDLGADHYTQIQPLRTKRRAIRQLQELGYTVTLQPAS